MTTIIEVRVPALPESITDATVLQWRHAVGATVAAAAPLVDLETDKIILEVSAPVDGVLTDIVTPSGSVVTADAVLARLTATASAVSDAVPAAPVATAPSVTDTPTIAPAARRLMTALHVNAADIRGSGKGGRIHKADVLAWLDRAEGSTATVDPDSVALPAATASGVDEIAAEAVLARPEQRVPMTRLRARIAQRLVAAQQQAALLTTFNEVDMSTVTALRQQYRDQFEQVHQVRLGFMSFFIHAAVAALQRFPVLNAAIDGNDIVYRQYYDIGIAVNTERGLVVPIIRQCERLSLADIERAIANFAHQARDGSLSIDDLTGGTFSITNGGVFGSLLSTPIVNPPQSAILGLHKIQERAVVVANQIVIRPMMYMALSYDHRLIDGRDAVQFLVCIKELIENPARLLLHI